MYEKFIGRVATVPYSNEKFTIKEINQTEQMTFAYSEEGGVINLNILLNEKGQFLTEEKDNEAQEDVGGNQERDETQKEAH